MTAERLRYAQSLMADRRRPIPEICRELGDIPTSTLYHYLHADGTLKRPARACSPHEPRVAGPHE